ncbi:hypothetical protein CMI47_05755 [Candidatus Pacearchaeota archaeon]|nr:hypothetical protein [Candidatus Pacearchaeota archaeon]|tara:strand:+ start:259 stop:984 length:726 start_codon:yes stop_codon:yes gene_type:complete
MPEDPIKQAFSKVKQDIFLLQSQLSDIKHEITKIKEVLDRQTQDKTDQQTDRHSNTAVNTNFPTQTPNKTHLSTDKQPLEALKTQNFNVSTGNEGVSTDRQTDQQTDTSTGNEGVKVRLTPIPPKKTSNIDNLEKVKQVLDSLDDIKKDLRTKFKALTNQEMEVFSTIYQLESKGLTVDYPLLSDSLGLTESSIRDYIQRLIKKGISLEKQKENNKKVVLKVSENLKKIASLATIQQLRNL